MNHDHTIDDLPDSFPLDPTLVDEIAQAQQQELHEQQQHQQQQHHQHHHHHHEQQHHHHHSDYSQDAHDLEVGAALAADFLASENGEEMSLGDASGVGSLLPLDPDAHLHQEVEEPVYNPRSRKRKLQLACHFCRRRKLKCDGVRPSCSNCSKRNELCDWDEAVRRRGPGKRTKAIRDRAGDEASGPGLHEASGSGSKHDMHGMDTSVYSIDSASSAADTNAALIAAVTAAAAEGAGSMEEYGTGEMSGGGAEGYGVHDEDVDVDNLHVEGLDGSEPDMSVQTAIEQMAAAVPSSSSDQHLIDPLDPNIDPTLSDLTNPATLGEASTSSPGIPISVSQLQQQQQQPHGMEHIRSQQIQAALQLQRQQHLHQQQQQSRKLTGVGVGVGVQIQAPNFGVGVIQSPNFALGAQMSVPSSLNGDGGLGAMGEVEGGDVSTVDALDWDKGYNFSAWPDLDLGSTTHQM